jgi:cathepsin L
MLKTLALLMLVACAMGAPATPQDFLTQEEWTSLWKAYRQLHNKTYTPSEEVERFRLFQERAKLVNEHNNRFAAGEESYSMELNANADKTVAEMMHRNGYIQNEDRSNEVEIVVVGNEGVPDSIDWRTHGMVTGVKDQGQCGSCWSFGTTGTLEGQWKKKHGSLVSLSEQNLVDCDTAWDNGCNGGLPTKAYQYIIKNGIDTESSYPYTAHQGSCKFSAAHVGAKMTSFKQVSRDSESALKNAVGSIGPVAVGIDASHMSFQLYSGGVYDEKSCSTTRLDHAVLVVGYGAENGKDYWLVKNSWGKGWGESGYIKMSRNLNNQCGIAHDASYPIV